MAVMGTTSPAPSSLIAGKNMPPVGVAPALILWNPKNAHNVGMALRIAACYGVTQLWFTGERVSLDPQRGERLPREERMRFYQDNVQLRQHDKPFDCFPKGVTPVAVEVRRDAVPLQHFEHPDNAVYVFGPEDDSIPSSALQHCHQFLVLPTRHCLNLSVAIGTVLSHRQMQRYAKGIETDLPHPGDFEDRGFDAGTGDLFDVKGAWDGNGR